MTLRVTPEYITSLKPNEIFVFGSNLAGMHGGGAAHIAHKLFGAKWGVGVGPKVVWRPSVRMWMSLSNMPNDIPNSSSA